MVTIGFIGLGTLGTPIACSIQNSGYSMVIYDAVSEKKRPLLDGGARLADSPEEVAKLSDITFTSLPGPLEVEQVALGPSGILTGINEGGIYVDLSTSQPALIRKIGKLFEKKNVPVLDAPILGSPVEAAESNVIVMPSGNKHSYEEVLPIFKSFASKVVYQGHLGMGSTCKLVNNMITLAVRQIIAEGLTLGLKAGLDLTSLMESGSRTVLGYQSEGLEKTVFKGQYEPASFRQALALKDITLANELGRDLDVPMPVANLVEQISTTVRKRGWGNLDTHVIYRLQEELSGVKIRP